MNFILLGYVSNNLNVCYFRHVKTRFKLHCKKISLKSNILFKLLEKIKNVECFTCYYKLCTFKGSNLQQYHLTQCPKIPGNLQILIFKMISLMYKGLSLQSFVKFVFRYTQIALKTIDIEKKA